MIIGYGGSGLYIGFWEGAKVLGRGFRARPRRKGDVKQCDII